MHFTDSLWSLLTITNSFDKLAILAHHLEKKTRLLLLVVFSHTFIKNNFQYWSVIMTKLCLQAQLRDGNYHACMSKGSSKEVTAGHQFSSNCHVMSCLA